MSDALARAMAYRERAQQMKRKAEKARTDELRRSWLVLEREWNRMADVMELKALEELPPLASKDSPRN